MDDAYSRDIRDTRPRTFVLVPEGDVEGEDVAGNRGSQYHNTLAMLARVIYSSLALILGL
jgi:hypothetical protein